MGCGSASEIGDVQRWWESDKYPFICYLAHWEEDWISDLIRSIAALPDLVKRSITQDCVEMMRALARLEAIVEGDTWVIQQRFIPVIHQPILKIPRAGKSSLKKSKNNKTNYYGTNSAPH